MPPRRANQTDPSYTHKTLVLDNGGHTVKVGFAREEPDASRDCHIIPNCIGRSNEDGGKIHKLYVADRLDDCKDTGEMAFRRPVEKGYVVNWESELEIWKQALFNKGAKVKCDPHETNLILTEAPNCPQALQFHADQIIFEEFEFSSAYRCLAGSLNAYNDVATMNGTLPLKSPPAECFVLVDSGYSHTTVTPMLYGRPVQRAIRRLDIGGKTLTNLLKELASVRHWNLMDDSYLVSQIKEDTSFVSQDFKTDLEAVWNLKNGKSKTKTAETNPGREIVQDYVLPDYRTSLRGHVRSREGRLRDSINDQTHLPLGNERFVISELFFDPSDIGLNQAGLPEIIIQSLSQLPSGTWPGMLANIVLTGGNANIPGFRDRLEKELRALTPADCALSVRQPEAPITYTWLGGARMASDRDILKKMVVTRQEYQEHGSLWTAQQFASAPRS